jgi:RNA polymerase sigma-70 factor (ECF subfamily)
VESALASSLYVDRPSEGSRTDRLRRAVDLHFDFLGRSLRRLGVAEASVEDAVQQVLLVLADRLDDVSEDKERAFLFGTAMRVASDFRKKQRRLREVATDVGLLQRNPDSAVTPDQLLDEARARELLDVVLDELPDDLRHIFILYELEELTMASIASLVELPPGTVASRLRRARATFEEIVARMRRSGRIQ